MREGVKQLELESEKLEQAFLLRHLPVDEPGQGGIQLLWNNLQAYWAVLLAQEPSLADLTPLLRATYPGCGARELLGLAAV